MPSKKKLPNNKIGAWWYNLVPKNKIYCLKGNEILLINKKWCLKLGKRMGISIKNQIILAWVARHNILVFAIMLALVLASLLKTRFKRNLATSARSLAMKKGWEEAKTSCLSGDLAIFSWFALMIFIILLRGLFFYLLLVIETCCMLTRIWSHYKV